ncbi:hypothetical protein NHX12_018698 [Muraenolepis orangiensis]|uniref:Uncharacterized protein n=1 Tax=Muraenolepis orangiensis TaxID=630683 RepID=A0A9Q0IY68_9TELE|nr:hypothetical protein NHX12_018698 [Muraenolepis orangiensis]
MGSLLLAGEDIFILTVEVNTTLGSMSNVKDVLICLPSLFIWIINVKICSSEQQQDNMTTPGYYADDDDDHTLDYDQNGFHFLCDKAVIRKFRLWFVSGFYTVIFVLGLLGNCLVIFTFLYFRRLKTMTDVYLLNLAFADLLFALSLPFWAANSMVTWVLGVVMCKAMHTVYKVSFYSSMLLLSCISVDRYFAITKAVSAHRHRAKTAFLSKLMTPVIWALALVLSIPEMMYANMHNDTCTLYPPVNASYSLQVSIQSTQVALGFIVPLLVMTFCYSAIAVTLRHSRSFERNRALKVILAVALVFFFCQVPYALVLVLNTLDAAGGGSVDCIHVKALLFANDVTQCLAFLRCCLNPFVYGFVGVKFRQDLLKLMRRLGCMYSTRFNNTWFIISPNGNPMPTVANMSHMIPSHVLRVGQTVRLDSSPEPRGPRQANSGSVFTDPELDVSLENLNQLILELDPTFVPLPVTRSPTSLLSSSYTGECSPEEDLYSSVSAHPRGRTPSPSPSIPIPCSSSTGPSCSPHGSLIFCSSPSSSSRPPLPCGSVHRRIPSALAEVGSSHTSLRTTYSNRNSGASMLSMSPGSDTSYMLGSCLSLASEDGSDVLESMLMRTSGSFSNVSRRSLDTRPSPTKPSPLGHFQELHSYGIHSSPASLAGSLTDIPVVLVNGAPEEMHMAGGPFIEAVHSQEEPPKPSIPHGFQAHFHGSQPSMKFVMDTSKFWFRPHINRAEAEALLKDKPLGVFVVRDSTSFRGCFGLVMKVEPDPNSISSTAAHAGENSSESVRHFLVESSAKGVRIKGSPHEPYFGSLSALILEQKTHIKTKTASNFLYLNTVPTEMLTGPCAVKRAVTSTLEKDSRALVIPTIVNFQVSQKGITLTDIKRKLFFRRHYPAHLLSYSGQDPDQRLWLKDSKFGARMFGFVAKGVEAGMENVCHVFAEHDPIQPCTEAIGVMQNSITKS